MPRLDSRKLHWGSWRKRCMRRFLPTTVTAAVLLCVYEAATKQHLPHLSLLRWSLQVLYTYHACCSRSYSALLPWIPNSFVLCTLFLHPVLEHHQPSPSARTLSPLLLNSDRLFISFCLAASPPTPLTRFALLFLHTSRHTRTVHQCAFLRACPNKLVCLWFEAC